MVWGWKNDSRLKPDEITGAWRRSLRAAVDEDWVAVETWLERIVEADSLDLDAYHALARLYRKQRAVGRAIRMHQNLLLRPDLPKKERADALFELARDFEEGGFVERAAASYEAFLDERPRHVEALERLIALLETEGEYVRGLALVGKLRRRAPESAEHLETGLLLAQARSSLEEGRHDVARKALKRSLKLNRNCGRAWEMLGELEAERGKSSRALEAWKKAAITDPEMASELYPRIGAGYAAAGKPTEFDTFLRGLIADRPSDSRLRVALVHTLASRGESTAALEEISRAVEVSPEDLSLRAELGRQLVDAGMEAEALKAYVNLLDQIEHDLSDHTKDNTKNNTNDTAAHGRLA